MGKIQILTKEQEIILAEVKKSEFLSANFYFTGGTALSAFYLHHRYSEDLDFFTEEKLDTQAVLTLVEGWSKKYGFIFTSDLQEVVYIFMLDFKKDIMLKVDFRFYPYRRIEKDTIINGVKTDSLIDIAVNKLLTITQRTTIKDFVDLYFLLQTLSLWDLVEGVRVKFGMRLEPYILASDFLKVEDFDYLPRMVKPLELDELKSFFREKAKEIGKKSTTK